MLGFEPCQSGAANEVSENHVIANGERSEP
jgi:hypothetical protein